MKIRNGKVLNFNTTLGNKRITKDFYIFLNDLSRNMFDCDGYESLPYRQKEWINNMISNELEKSLDSTFQKV